MLEFDAIIQQIAQKLGLQFISEHDSSCNVCQANSPEVRPEYRQTFTLIDVQDYLYAVMHTPPFRETDKAFLKFDVSSMPPPKDDVTFWQLVALGGELRQMHLLESPKVEK